MLTQVQSLITILFLFTFVEEMKISKKELANAKVPLHLRDYCAHLMVPLLECRRNTYFLPWKCKHERHEWEVCEYTEYVFAYFVVIVVLYNLRICSNI